MNSNILITEALRECEIALGKPEQWFFSCTMLSNLLADQREEQLAFLWKNLARQTQVSHPTYHVLAGVIYAHLGEWQEAIQHNKKAIGFDEKLAIAYSNLSELYKRIDEPQTSSEYYYQYLSMQPEASEAKDCEVLGTELLQRGQLSKALDCYRWAIKNDPEHWDAYYRIAHLLTQAQQPERAIRYYQLLLERDPSQAEAHQKLGKLFLNQQEYGKAIEQFRSAIQQKPKFIWPYLGLTQGFIALEQWDDAIESCQAALRSDDSLLWAYRHMAQALMAQKEEAKASACLLKVAALSGWNHCVERDYHFTRDPFTHKISLWLEQLQDWIDLPARTTPLQVLQVGTRQGMWSCWCLDQVLTHPEDKLLCLDQAFSPLFKLNIEKSKPITAVDYQQGKSTELLVTLCHQSIETHDLIYIQERPKEAQSLSEEIQLAWTLLKGGGMMVIEDSGKTLAAREHQQSSKAILEKFLREILESFELTHQGKLLFIHKAR